MALPSGQAALSNGIDQISPSEMYVAYSALDRDSLTLPLRMDATVSMFVVRGNPIPNSNLREVVLFGSGYGNPNGVTKEAGWNVLGRNYEVLQSATYDASNVDYVIQRCFGMTPARTRLTYVSPHGHQDHTNADFFLAMKAIGYQLTDMTLFVGTPDLTSTLDQNQDGTPDVPTEVASRITLIGPSVFACGATLRDLPVASGTLRVISFPGHTNGTLNLLHVENDWEFLGADLGSCSQAGHANYFPAHGRARIGGAPPQIR